MCDGNCNCNGNGDCKCGSNIKLQSLSDHVTQDEEPREVRVLIYRNRSEMECSIIEKETGELLFDRLPVEWKARENKLDYLSVSKMEAYKQCPACFYRQYMAEETASVDGSNYYTKFGSILHEVVEKAVKYYRDNGIIVDPVALYNEAWKCGGLVDFQTYLEGKELIEQHFKCYPIAGRGHIPVMIEEEWRGELGGCTFGLMIDYAGIMKNNKTAGILADYKTNRVPFTPIELETSLQLRVYEIVLRRFLMPEIKTWTSGYEMFRFGWQQCPTRTQADLDDAEQYISNMWYQITHDNTWAETLNNYCGYRDCRYTCKTYQDYLANPKRYIDIIDNSKMTDLTEIDKQKELMTTYEKIAKKRKEECGDILKSAVEKAVMAGERIVIDGKQLELFAQSKQSYNYYDTRNVLIANNKVELLDGCLSIAKTKFDKVVQSDPTLKLQLAGCMNTSYSTPYIIKKKA